MSENEFPYSYFAYGLKVMSQIPVTGFKSIPFEVPDVIIAENIVPENLENIVNTGVLFQSNDHEFLLRFKPVANYFVSNGNKITVQRSGKATDTEISAFLTGTCFGALLHQRMLLPLHASTVIFRNKCLLLAGISGSGKTTLATAILKTGGTLVADDISVIDFSGITPNVRPSFPAVKIWADSLKHLGIPAEGLVSVRSEQQKYYLPVPLFSGESTGIDHIIIMNTYNRPAFEFKSILGVDKFRLLKKHTYLFHGIPKTGLEINHFQLVNRLAAETPVSQLIRPNYEFDTGKLIEVISANI